MPPSERVAVVVPCFNAERTLAATLESSLAEQGAEVEIIVIDDGSTDGSLALARCYEPRVRVLTGPNRGASAARNRGIAETTAPWLLFLDADDLLEPGTLAKRLDAARARSADVVVTDWVDIIDDGTGAAVEGARRSIDWPALRRDAEAAIVAGVWATTAAILYGRDIVCRIGGFRPDLPIIQDARFFFDAAYQGARFAHADHVGARYRVLAGSLSRADPARFHLDCLTNARQIESLWRASGKLDERHRRTMLEVHNTASRGLFRVAHPGYFEAIEAQRGLGLRLPLHSRLAPALARMMGLERARSLLSIVGRA